MSAPRASSSSGPGAEATTASGARTRERSPEAPTGKYRGPDNPLKIADQRDLLIASSPDAFHSICCAQSRDVNKAQHHCPLSQRISGFPDGQRPPTDCTEYTPPTGWSPDFSRPNSSL